MVTYAGELAAGIDEQCEHVTEDEVDDIVRGYTIFLRGEDLGVYAGREYDN